MKVRPQAMPDVVSIERVLKIELDEDESLPNGELDEGTYALDSTGRVWKMCEAMSGLVEQFTEHDGVKRTRAKRTSQRT